MSNMRSASSKTSRCTPRPLTHGRQLAGGGPMASSSCNLPGVATTTSAPSRNALAYKQQTNPLGQRPDDKADLGHSSQVRHRQAARMFVLNTVFLSSFVLGNLVGEGAMHA